MTFVWVAVGTAAVGAGASVYGANKQAKASQKAGQLNMDMFNTLNRQQQPFIGSGYGAMGRLNTLLGINPRPQSSMSPTGPPGGMPIQGSGLARMMAEVRARQLAQQGGGNSYMPTPGGGVQPILSTGGTGNAYLNRLRGQDPSMYAGGPGGDPYMNRNARLNQILSLRAANGDTQAADMMRSIAGLGAGIG